MLVACHCPAAQQSRCSLTRKRRSGRGKLILGQTAVKSSKSFLLRIINLENGNQLGDLQSVADAGTKADEFDIGTCVAGRRIGPNERAQTAAIHVTDSAEIENDLFGRLENFFNHVAKGLRL